jgi:hypothetical protein
MDYAKELIWGLFEKSSGTLPPYLLEIVMRDGRSFYVHSFESRDKKTKSMILIVYDVSAIDPEEEYELKTRLDQTGHWSDSSSVDDLHTLLKIGRLRCSLDEIAYCMEWLGRRWTLDDFIEKEGTGEVQFEFGNDEE